MNIQIVWFLRAFLRASSALSSSVSAFKLAISPLCPVAPLIVAVICSRAALARPCSA